MKKLLIFICVIFSSHAFAKNNNQNILNIYAWSGEIPDFIIQQFEKETGIKVNFSTYGSNEVLYAKLKADKVTQYDIIEPSSYYIDRMRRQGMLEKLDRRKIPGFKNLNPDFLYKPYDPESNYSVPYVWGITGIFVNKHKYPTRITPNWASLWNKKFLNQLMLLDDSREVFSMALKSLGYSANDSNPKHIHEAYDKLRKILPNIKLFKSDGVISVLADGDIDIGMAWNGDVFKASQENKNLSFVFPKEGFVIWVDNFAIPKNAPHLNNAYRFLNFILRADVARDACIDNGYPSANLAARQIMPPTIRNNPIAYPTQAILKHGEFQTDISDDALALYEKYWEKLKMGE
ncbi:MAG: spermidine/putrescine ABC transporter substrate-binding protein [Gammaproteobacteria bacterium]|nr:spermidine/putrescine ABC transporter substrate-binding protein [Gammaproteobacteria bacterium]